MNDLKFLRTAFSVFFFAISLGVSAQVTRGDKLFLEGQTLQQTMTIASQNAAIKKFQQAKNAFTTNEKKSQCDNQIAICKKTIDRLRSGGGGSIATAKTTQATSEKDVKLSLTPDTVFLDGAQQGTATITVTASNKDWVFNSDNTSSEQAFAQVTKSDDAKTLNVSVDMNPSTLCRQQTVTVTHKNDSKMLTIIQRGKPVTLSANATFLDFKAKGGEKKIELYTNSDSIYEDTNDLTWIIESKPDWIDTRVEVAKERGVIAKAFHAGKTALQGKAVAATKADVKPSTLIIIARPIPKKSAELETGRQGVIVFASQDKRYKLDVSQQ